MRSGEHPRSSLRRLDLLDDAALDAFRVAHPDRSGAAMDAAIEAEERLERALSDRGLDDAALGRLPTRPILAVFICLECGASAIAPASRAWDVDRAMRRTGLGERDILALTALLRDAFGGDAPTLDAFSIEGHDHHESALRKRVLELAGCQPRAEHRGSQRQP